MVRRFLRGSPPPLVLLGAGALLLSLWLPWYMLRQGYFVAYSSSAFSGWRVFSVVDIALAVAAGVSALAIVLRNRTSRRATSALVLGMSALATGLVAYRLVYPLDLSALRANLLVLFGHPDAVRLTPDYGAWTGLFGSILMLTGSGLCLFVRRSA